MATHAHAGGHAHRDRVATLDVGLVEAREQAVCLVGLEVGVGVLLAVLGIDEVMEAVTSRVVVVDVDDMNGHIRRDDVGRQDEPVAVPVGRDGRAVDLQQLDLSAAEVEEDGAAAGGGEADGRVAAIGGLAGEDVEGEVVVRLADAGCALPRLGLGQDIARAAASAVRLLRSLRQSLGMRGSVTPVAGCRVVSQCVP